MATETVGAVQSSEVSQSTLGQEDLFKILLTQLNYQDPLKPMDNQEFIAQLAQFTALEQARTTNEKLDQLLQAESVGQAISLLDREIQVAQDSASPVVGKVTAVSFDNGNPRFTITPATGNPLSDIPLSQVQLISGTTTNTDNNSGD